MAAIEATRRGQGNHTRQRPAVPVAIPLKYSQKFSTKTSGVDKHNITSTVTVTHCITPPPSVSEGPVALALITSAIAKGASIPVLSGRTHPSNKLEGKPASAGVPKPNHGTIENGGLPSVVDWNCPAPAAAPVLNDNAETMGSLKDDNHSRSKQAGDKEILATKLAASNVATGKTRLPRRAKETSNQITAGDPTGNYCAKGQSLRIGNETYPNGFIDIAETGADSLGVGFKSNVGDHAQQAESEESDKPNTAKVEASRPDGPETGTLFTSRRMTRRPRNNTSPPGQPNQKASSVAAAAIKALNELADAKKLAATVPFCVSQSNAIEDSGAQDTEVQASAMHVKPVTPYGHSQAHERPSKTSLEGTGPISLMGNWHPTDTRQGSPSMQLREDLERRHLMHQAHPSQGSMNFGDYPGSLGSSPAPHVTTGRHRFGPHPPLPQSMPPAMSSFPAFPPGLGYSPQPTPRAMHSPGLNDFSRHHYPQSFGPSPSGTPGIENLHHFHHSPAHSLHHTPILHAQQLFMPRIGHGPSPTKMNGSDGQPHRASLPSIHGEVFNGPSMQPAEDGDALDGLLGYIQMQFHDPTHADLILEVRLPPKDGIQSLPLHIPSHSLFLARSPTLRHLMAGGFTDNIFNGVASRLITLDLDDSFVGPQSLWIALQRLYGGALLTEATMPNPSTPPTDMETNRLNTHKFDIALGYAAAGHILQMEPVVHRGMQVACNLLDWNTLLKALDFAGAVVDPEVGPERVAPNGAAFRKYGPASELLIAGALSFIVANFPARFELDATVADPESIRRLPNPVSITKHHQKLSGMKFGDFGLDDDAVDVDIRESQPSSPTTTPAILSSVMLNLPFVLLKYVLESHNLGERNGKLKKEERVRIMTEVIKERERRRCQAAEKWQQRPLNASQVIARSTKTQQEQTLWWLESVIESGGRLELHRELKRTPFGHELPA